MFLLFADLLVKVMPYATEYSHSYKNTWGYVVAQLVEALRYKPEGRGFDSRWCHWNFSLT